MTTQKSGRCWLFHDWGFEMGWRLEGRRLVPNWFRGVPDSWAGTMRPDEKVCGRCGRRRRLRWGIGLFP